jgi:hypothetical protein
MKNYMCFCEYFQRNSSGNGQMCSSVSFCTEEVGTIKHILYLLNHFEMIKEGEWMQTNCCTARACRRLKFLVAWDVTLYRVGSCRRWCTERRCMFNSWHGVVSRKKTLDSLKMETASFCGRSEAVRQLTWRHASGDVNHQQYRCENFKFLVSWLILWYEA